MNVDIILKAKGNQVHTVTADQRISDAIAVLNNNNIGVVVVVADNGKTIGILSERDIIRKLGADATAGLLAPVKQFMTPDPVSCNSQMQVDEVLTIMTRRRIRHMPVIEGDSLLGLISIGDVVKHKIAATEQEAAALRDYIAS